MAADLTVLLNEFDQPQPALSESEEKPIILVIDDDLSILRALSKAFAHRYSVLTAESGPKGIDLLTEKIHCVILDVKMRELNGFSTYPKLKQKSPEVPIIFYTAFQSEHDLQDVINKYKPEGYVQKGRDLSFLGNLIENAVKKYHLHLENEKHKNELIELNRSLEQKVAERTKHLLEIETQKHLLELDLTLGLQVQEIMHTDSAILINPVATHFNVTGDVLSAFIDYKASLKEGKVDGQALDDLLAEIERMEQTQKIGRGVIDDYRRNFKALHELRASQNINRDPNEDLIYLRDLVNSQFAFTNAEMDLDLGNDIPVLCLSRRAQSSYLELAINALRHGKATKLLAKTENIKGVEKGFATNMVGIHIYNNGLMIPENKNVFDMNNKSAESTGFGLKSAKARIELNGGFLRLEPSDIPGYNVHFAIYFPLKPKENGDLILLRQIILDFP